MKTPQMFMRFEDGSLARVPAADAAVLDRYRDAGTVVQPEDAAVFERYPVMPVVYEPQFSGDPFPLYPLVDEEPEDGRYTCYPLPGTIVDTRCGRTITVHQMPPRVPEPVYVVGDWGVACVEVGPCSDVTVGR